MLSRSKHSVEAIIARALNQIEAQVEEHHLEVERSRVLRKRKTIQPTDRQTVLLRFIRRHGRISFEESLGMDWRFLGGLFTRGLVVWTKEGGHTYVAAHDVYESKDGTQFRIIHGGKK
jgi:hypothetical protein